MSLSTILIVFVFVVLLVWLSKQNAKPKSAPALSAPSVPTPKVTVTPPSVPSVPSPPSVPSVPSVLPAARPKVYEMIDFENPRMSVNNKILAGSRLLILPDSKRTNELRKRFNAKNVLDRIRFNEDSNVIEVYRVVSDNVYTYMFPDAKSDEIIIQLVTQVSEDPSGTKVPKTSTNKMPQMVVGVPAELIASIRGLEVLYSKRKSSTGPKAIDTHSSTA